METVCMKAFPVSLILGRVSLLNYDYQQLNGLKIKFYLILVGAIFIWIFEETKSDVDAYGKQFFLNTLTILKILQCMELSMIFFCCVNSWTYQLMYFHLLPFHFEMDLWIVPLDYLLETEILLILFFGMKMCIMNQCIILKNTGIIWIQYWNNSYKILI